MPYWITFISPSSAFDLGMAVEALVILLLAGAGTVMGPVIGALFVEFLATINLDAPPRTGISA